MKQIILCRKTTCLLTLIVIMLLAWGCSDKLVDNNSNPVAVKLETSIAAGELADVVSLFRLTVTGPDMEPIIAVQTYDGGPLVFELDIPAGRGRVFLLEGIHVSDTGERVIYAASAVADIEPDVAVNLTLHMEPVVPLIRFTPLRTVTASGQSFIVDLEIFNVPGLLETELLIQFDTGRLVLDSIAKGSGLDESDVLEPIVGSDLPGLQIIIYDPNDPATGIVDETGYSHLARVYFTSNIQLESAVTALEVVGLSYIASGGAQLLPGQVFSHAASVEIIGFEAGLLRVLPADTAVQPDGAFGLRIEGYNLLTLYEADLELTYDHTILRLDSVVKGASLLGSDTIIASEGASAGIIELNVSDLAGVAGSIVNTAGFSHMATVYFTALRPPNTTVTPVDIAPLLLLASEAVGGSIPLSDVTAEGAAVTVAGFSDALMRFIPIRTDLVSSEYFTLEVELFNTDNLRRIEFGLVYETDYVRFDSVTKGITLDASDAVWMSEGGAGQPVVIVEDTTTAGGVIVNEQGNSSLATLYFRSNIISSAATTTVAPAPIALYLLGGDSIKVADVAIEDATVNISPFPDEPITFEDPGLEAAVRYAIAYPTGTIMWSQVYDLASLSASYYEIVSLGGIEKLVSLQFLYLSSNNISDLTPLQQLPALFYLYLYDNQITDISPLSTMVHLTYLDLGAPVDIPNNNAISDVSPLANLTNINYLYLQANAVADISSLVSGSIFESGDYVDLSYNPLTSGACTDVQTLINRGVTVVENSCGVAR